MSEMLANNMAVAFEDLPLEILNNIINFLGAKDLKTALCVNKRWNAVASRLAEKKKVFVVELIGHTLSASHPFVETLMKSKRNFQHCLFDNCEFKEGSLAFLRKLGPQLNTVAIRSETFDHHFDYLLRKCTKLEKLAIITLDQVEMDFLDIMPQLTDLYFLLPVESLETIGSGETKVFPNLKIFDCVNAPDVSKIIRPYFPSASIRVGLGENMLDGFEPPQRKYLRKNHPRKIFDVAQ